jgi:hypothetical protein
MLELAGLLLAVIALLKALERWAMPLFVRFRPHRVIDPTGAGFHTGGGDHAGLDGG